MGEILDYFIRQKANLNSVIQSFLEHKRQEIESRIPWADDVLCRLKPFVANGKMVRGGLVVLAHQMFAGAFEKGAFQAGAAMEMFQTAFLIHDDIIDRDSLRRGDKTVFQQYLERGREEQLPAPERFGDAMATCAGDVAFFLAFELLNELPVPPDLRQEVTRVALRENAKVGLGQMQDVYFGFLPESVTEEEIFTVFRCKTATYTFVLPMLAGSVLAGQKADELFRLREFGETMGLIFQIRDDELGLFGEAKDIGKPIGNDVRQGKKTLFHLYLMQASQGEERRRLERIFGNSQIGREEIQWVRELLVERGIRRRLRHTLEQLAEKARGQLEDISFPVDSCRQILREIIDYSWHRDN